MHWLSRPSGRVTNKTICQSQTHYQAGQPLALSPNSNNSLSMSEYMYVSVPPASEDKVDYDNIRFLQIAPASGIQTDSVWKIA